MTIQWYLMDIQKWIIKVFMSKSALEAEKSKWIGKHVIGAIYPDYYGSTEGVCTDVQRRVVFSPPYYCYDILFGSTDCFLRCLYVKNKED